jgi:4-amino-4-deoxychorismate lyase
VIFDTALAVEAQILGHRAVGQVADVLARDGVQPAEAVLAGQFQHGSVRTVHDHDGLGRGALLAERVAVVPYGACIGGRVWCVNCGHGSTLRRTARDSLRPMTPQPDADDIVVGLGGELIDARAPVLCADDPIVGRGDGVFETLLVRDGLPCLLTAHLVRLAESAGVVGLPAPDVDGFRQAVGVAVARWDGGEAVLRLLYGRSRGGSVGFVTVSALPERVRAARRDGVAAVTVDRGVPAYDVDDAPWSLARVKSLSYAPLGAAQRHAERLGATDALLVSSDGFVLEGARSTVVIAPRAGVLQTPRPSSPLLPGTTAQALFTAARRHGWRCDVERLRVEDLHAAQGLWLLSSVTLAARVSVLDGAVLPAAPMAAEVTQLVDAAILADG